jgi:hypothetical protein
MSINFCMYAGLRSHSHISLLNVQTHLQGDLIHRLSCLQLYHTLKISVHCCKGNLVGALSVDSNSQRSPPTEPALPVPTPGLVILNESNRCSGPASRPTTPSRSTSKGNPKSHYELTDYSIQYTPSEGNPKRKN